MMKGEGSRRAGKQQQKLQNELEAMAGSKSKLERNVRDYDEDRQWQLPEAGAFAVFVVMAGKCIVVLIRLKNMGGREKDCKKPHFLLYYK